MTKLERIRAQSLEVTFKVGKEGLTEGVLNQLKEQFKKQKMIKIKLSPTFMSGKDKKAMAQELANATNTTVIQQVGFVVVLAKKR